MMSYRCFFHDFVFGYSPIHLSKSCLEASIEGNSPVKVKLFTCFVADDMTKKRVFSKENKGSLV